MRKVVFSSLLTLCIVILAGCNKAKELSDYVDVNFSGLDTKGVAAYEVDMERLFKDVLDFDMSTDFPDQETEFKMKQIAEGFVVKMDPTDNLSNGDTVKLILSVDDKQTDKIKGGEKEITVEGLEEPLVLTSEEATKHLVLNFNGVSGKGEAKIDNTLSKPLNEVRFAVTNDGELKNGEKATLVIDETLEEQLISRGYVVGNDFNPTFEVKGLHIVAENATEIANFKDLERMIDEQIKRTYKDIFPESSLGSTYDIKREKLMYRQFKNEADKEGAHSASNHGNLIGIYTVKKYANSEEGELQAQFTAINGFADIYLDDQQHANPATLKNIQNRKDDTYSLESIIQLYEGYGYAEVK